MKMRTRKWSALLAAVIAMTGFEQYYIGCRLYDRTYRCL